MVMRESQKWESRRRWGEIMIPLTTKGVGEGQNRTEWNPNVIMIIRVLIHSTSYTEFNQQPVVLTLLYNIEPMRFLSALKHISSKTAAGRWFPCCHGTADVILPLFWLRLRSVSISSTRSEINKNVYSQSEIGSYPVDDLFGCPRNVLIANLILIIIYG